MLKQVQHDEMMEEEGKNELLSNSEKSLSSVCSASSVIKESGEQSNRGALATEYRHGGRGC